MIEDLKLTLWAFALILPVVVWCVAKQEQHTTKHRRK